MTTTSAESVAPPLRRDRMAHIWIGVRALSDAGDAIWTIALAWTAVQVASPATAGAVVAAGTFPRAVVLLVGGAVADRYDARRIMVLANLTRIAVLVATAVWVVTTGPSVAVLLLAAVAFGLTDAIYEPSASTIGRQLVRASDLPAYSGLSQTATRLGLMGGSAVGGILVAQRGIEGSASVNALTFVAVVAFIVVWLRPRFPLVRAEPEPVLRGIAGGFRHLRTAATTRTLVLALSGLNLAIAPALGLGIPLRALENGWGAHTVGYLEALVGVGAALGALSMFGWHPRLEARTGFWLLGVQGIAIVVLGIGSVWLTAVVCFVIGTTAGSASALLGAVFVSSVDGAYFGRMVSIQRLGDDVFMPGAMIAFGVLASATSLSTTFLVFGGMMAALMYWPLSNRVLMSVALRGHEGAPVCAPAGGREEGA